MKRNVMCWTVMLGIICGMLCMAACGKTKKIDDSQITDETTKQLSIKDLKDWKDSLSCPLLEDSVRINLAISLCDSYWSKRDSVICLLLTEDMLDKEFEEDRRIILKTSSDKRALMLTLPGDGYMCTGKTYILYRKDNGSTVVKKVAYPEQLEGGGVAFPALFKEIKDTVDGYYLCGMFSFSSHDDEYTDTMMLDKEFLESDSFER